MGRFRKKKYYNNKQAVGNGNENTTTTTNNNKEGFSPRQKKQLLQYLEKYREENNDGRASVPVLTTGKDGPTSTSAFSKNNTSSHTVVIAGIELPNLALPASFAQPYLQLPAEFSFKQRQGIHDACVQVGIYHCGIGRYKSDERCIVISIYGDVFDKVHGFRKPDYLGLYRSVRPWFCQNTKSSSSQRNDQRTESFRERVQELIDQPWKCIREGIDVLDFDALEGQDLSTVPPPGFVEDQQDGATVVDTNWVLVDTAEKMKQCIQELQVSTVLVSPDSFLLQSPFMNPHFYFYFLFAY